MTTPRGAHRPVAASLLATLSPATATEIVTLGARCSFRAGRVLLHEGELSTHVYLLLAGIVKVTATTPEGGFALLAIRTVGDLVGELAELDGQPRSATVVAAGAVEARVITRSVFDDFLNRHTDAAMSVSRSIAAKLRFATRRRVDFSGCEVRVRLARVLVELVATYGEQTAAGVHIGLPLTQPELAALVGAAEPTVHQVLAALRKDAVIGTGYRSITVVDPSALRVVAEEGTDRSTGNRADTG